MEQNESKKNIEENKVNCVDGVKKKQETVLKKVQVDFLVDLWMYVLQRHLDICRWQSFKQSWKVKNISNYLKKGFYRFVHGFGKTAFCFQKLKLVLLEGKVFLSRLYLVFINENVKVI